MNRYWGKGKERHLVNHETVKTVYSKAEPEKKNEPYVLKHTTSFSINFNLGTVIFWILFILGIVLIYSSIKIEIN